MGINKDHGVVAMNGTEQTLADKISLNNHALYVFLHNMLAGDTITIRVYADDEQAGGVLRLIDSFSYSGFQSKPAIFITYYTADEYKVTAQQTTGTNRNVNWKYYSI